MQAGTITAQLNQSHHGLSGASISDRHASHWNRKAVINAPMEEVIATFASHMNRNDGPRCELGGSMDPTYSCSDRVLGQSFGVRYVFYEIPGGTQVDATIEHPSQSFTRSSFARAVRRERRRIAGDLATVKDRLE